MNEYEVELAKQFAIKTAELGKEITSDLINPSAKILGKNLGLMVDGVFGWLGCWGEIQKNKQQAYIDDFKKKTSSKILAIPEKNLVEPKMYIVGPVIEAIKYSYEEDYFRDMFSSLLAAACDKESTKYIHPSFIDIIKQLSPLDAKLINLFKDANVYPMCDIRENVSKKRVVPYRCSLFDFMEKKDIFSRQEYLRLSLSFNNLNRLGLLFKNREILYSGYDYFNFKKNVLYSTFEAIKENPEGELTIIPARLELTELGIAFRDCCIREK